MKLTVQAAEFEAECTSCRHPCRYWAVQLVSRGRLGWELNWSCLGCGIEADDVNSGPAPEYIRGRLIERYGSTHVRGGGTDAHGGRVLKVFRDVFGWSVQDAKQAATELTTTGWRGTQVEVSLVAHLLQESGVEVTDGEDEQPSG
ncbi:hypothetical protein SSPS47_14030 [Streptomyces sp. S4.7]|uniref:hypothetical protein n=1 Tax=Streptomyces sp. S4.7 TaxID=2705439 RepID=UPI001398A966|nr:hypothetical protein [Streptomyces sp. S4.7]QHY96231.1 hypothetical protein SSPS47_14030 [Streptomyces sp. S4.7]